MMFSRGIEAVRLLQDLGDDAGADGAAAFADGEAQLFFHGDGGDELDRHLGVVARHHHLHPRRQLHRPRHVGRAKIKLRPIPLEKRRVPAPLLLRQHVHLRLELRVRRDRPRLRHHHPPLHLVLLPPPPPPPPLAPPPPPPPPPPQQPHVVPRLPLVQQLPKHRHPRHHRPLLRPKPHQLHLVPHPHPPPLNPPRHHRPPPRNRKHILHRQQKRLVHLPHRHRNVAVQRLQQLPHLPHPTLLPLQRLQRRPPNHRHLVPRILILRQQLPHLQLHQLHQLRILHQITLVQKHHNRRHIHLPRQQNMLPRLRHRPIHRTHHQNRPVHLRRPRDHILHVVGMPRTIHMRIMPRRRAVLHMRRRNRQNLRRIPPPLRRRRLRHLVVRHIRRPPLRRRYLRNRRRQRRLPMIHMPNRPHIHMRLRPLKLDLPHDPLDTCVVRDPRWPAARRAGQRGRRRPPPRPTPCEPPVKLATGIEPVTSSLPRTRSTD